ncbi:MAG: aspartate carbamoyltransferase catalytic subunit [Patescibacteria group bacterium]|jgi:aspartate carbamoyltransferase catalytic subunit|nr:aspartate carbamoyltransferase catalytic subunit [Patescibacteria group bacterium]
MQKIDGNFKGKDIISISQFSKEDIEQLFTQANRIRSKIEAGEIIDALQGRIMANLFYEPSTRTSSSFVAAMQRLGGGFIQINDVHYSSVSKGENLSDTVRTLENYADVIVLRHHDKGHAKIAADASSKPVINAGDGTGEHPTQALLDLYTIAHELGHLDNVEVSMIGDLKNGRTVHSLAHLLAMYGASLNYVAPESLQMPRTIVEELNSYKVQQSQLESIEAVINKSDVLYVTRVQKERFSDASEYEALKDSFTLTTTLLERAKKSAIVMHPLPRVNEIHPDVDQDPRAVYFTQVKNGMYVRMALLCLVLGKPV